MELTKEEKLINSKLTVRELQEKYNFDKPTKEEQDRRFSLCQSRG